MRASKAQFATIFVSLACGDTGVLLVYLLWVAPIIYTQRPLALTQVSISVSTFLVNVPFFAAGYSALVMAVNRYEAVHKPTKYAELYEKRKLIARIAACWIIATCGASVYAVPNCGYYVDPRVYQWVGNENVARCVEKCELFSRSIFPPYLSVANASFVARKR